MTADAQPIDFTTVSTPDEERQILALQVALVMPRAFASDVPILRPLFEMLDDGLYRAMAEVSRPQYDFTVTEVAARNTRSLRAHARAGFGTLQVYPDATTGEDWHVLVLDFAGSEGRAGFKETTRPDGA